MITPELIATLETSTSSELVQLLCDAADCGDDELIAAIQKIIKERKPPISPLPELPQ